MKLSILMYKSYPILIDDHNEFSCSVWTLPSVRQKGHCGRHSSLLFTCQFSAVLPPIVNYDNKTQPCQSWTYDCHETCIAMVWQPGEIWPPSEISRRCQSGICCVILQKAYFLVIFIPTFNFRSLHGDSCFLKAHWKALLLCYKMV